MSSTFIDFLAVCNESLEIIFQSKGEILFELEITEVVVVVLQWAVVVEAPQGEDICGDVFGKLVGEDVLHFGFYVFEGGEAVTTTFPCEVLHDGKLTVELDSRTIVLRHAAVFELVDFVDVLVVRIDEPHFVG